jgi:hypothetical protein
MSAQTPLCPVEAETLRQRFLQRAQSLQGLFPATIAADLKSSRPGGHDFDFVFGLQLQCLYHCLRQPDGQVISPFRDAHKSLSDIQRICISEDRIGVPASERGNVTLEANA